MWSGAPWVSWWCARSDVFPAIESYQAQNSCPGIAGLSGATGQCFMHTYIRIHRQSRISIQQHYFSCCLHTVPFNDLMQCTTCVGRFGKWSKKINVCDVYCGMLPTQSCQEVGTEGETVHCATVTCQPSFCLCCAHTSYMFTDNIDHYSMVTYYIAYPLQVRVSGLVPVLRDMFSPIYAETY